MKLESINISDIKMIAFDLDGTILTDDKRISQRTYNALKLAAKRGIELVPSSGRLFAGIPDEIKSLTGVNYMITTNGAAVYTPAGELLKETALKREVAVEIINKVDRQRAIAAAYIDGKGYMEAEDLALVPGLGLHKSVYEYFRTTRHLVPDLPGFIINQEHDIQLLVFAVNPNATEVHAEIAKIASKHAGVSLVFGSPHDMDIANHKANKGAALLYIADLLDISPESVAAFGDSENDEALLSVAGLKIAMANGSDRLKAMANITAPSNNADGVAIVIENLLGL